jgi:hypothetical protein
MLRTSAFKLLAAASMLMAISNASAADDADPCKRFTWDVTRELAVMKQAPQNIVVGLKPGADVPQLDPDKLYSLKLAAQNTVTFAVKPAKPTLEDGAQAGLLRFRVPKAGHYRVSMTSGHWVDVIDGTQVMKSLDFQGQRGCERPRKIVEYELPAGRDLTLQLSGATDAEVLVAVTAAPTG